MPEVLAAQAARLAPVADGAFAQRGQGRTGLDACDVAGHALVQFGRALGQVKQFDPLGRPALGQDEGGKRMRLYLGKKEDSTAISYRVGGQERTMLVSISDAMKERLLAQWKSARRS